LSFPSDETNQVLEKANDAINETNLLLFIYLPESLAQARVAQMDSLRAVNSLKAQNLAEIE